MSFLDNPGSNWGTDLGNNDPMNGWSGLLGDDVVPDTNMTGTPAPSLTAMKASRPDVGGAPGAKTSAPDAGMGGGGFSPTPTAGFTQPDRSKEGMAMADGGALPDPDQEDHGGMPGDDAASVIDQLFGHLRNTFGITQPKSGEQGFADGGGVPDAAAQPRINPKRAMAYLQGAGAAAPQQAEAMRREVDPRGQMTPGQRNSRAIAHAAKKYGPQAGMAQLQHDRQKYNAYKGAALVALHRSKGAGNVRPQ